MPGLDEWDVSSKQLANAHGYAARTDYHKDNAKAQATMQLAREILKLARSTLLIHLRFMEPALVRLAANGDESITAELATDGRYLYYNSIHVCRLFKRARELPARDYLHVTLHCVFRHLFVGRKLIGDLWDLACDIAVENLINELDIKSLYCERQEKQRWLIEKLREAMPRLTAERIYHWLIEQDLPPQEVGRIRGYFYADDHRVWHNPPEMAPARAGIPRTRVPAAKSRISATHQAAATSCPRLRTATVRSNRPEAAAPRAKNATTATTPARACRTARTASPVKEGALPPGDGAPMEGHQ